MAEERECVSVCLTFIGVEQSWDGRMDTVSGAQIGTLVICPGSPLPYLEGRCKNSYRESHESKCQSRQTVPWLFDREVYTTRYFAWSDCEYVIIAS